MTLVLLLTSCGGSSDLASSLSSPNGTIDDSLNGSDDSSEHTHDYRKSAIDPTCTEKGYTTYTCSCGDSYVDDYVDELGHDLIAHEGKVATCTDIGWDAYQTCSRCDYSTYEEISAKGHSFGDYVIDLEATCTTEGHRYQICADCGFKNEETIDALGHDIEEHGEQPATCTEDGLSSYTTCTRCDYSTPCETIPALGHNYVDGVCTRCQKHNSTSGLEYAYSSDRSYCSVRGIGTATDTEIVIPETYEGLPVAGIESRAFFGLTSITSVEIPDSVTSIGAYAFQGCTSLTSIDIPDSVTYLGIQAFCNCSGLTTVNIGGGITSFGNDVFFNCTSLTDVNISEGVTQIGKEAFRSCSSLTAIVIPDSVISLGQEAFVFCSELVSVTLGDGLASIGQECFSHCYALSSVTFGSGISSIGSSSFNFCPVVDVRVPSLEVWLNISFADDYANPIFGNEETNLYVGESETAISGHVTIPQGVVSIPAGAFSGCKQITGITMGDEVTSIGGYAFHKCAGLSEVELGDNVTSIKAAAFQYCTSLKKMVFPDKVASIASHSFRGCTSLTRILIGSGVTTINKYAFDGCTHLLKVYYNGDSEGWSAMTIGTYNTYLVNATRYYFTANGDAESASGNWWYYDDNGNIIDKMIG